MKRFIVDSLAEPLLSRQRLLMHLMFWARTVRRIKRPLVIGVTGSVGKSTTTAMIAHVLSRPECLERIGPIVSTSNNMNDEMGLSATVLLMKRFDFPYSYTQRFMLLCWLPFRAMHCTFRTYPRTLVLEYGAGIDSFLRRHVRIAPPNISIVTTIGSAHLERMGSIEGVVEEKSILLRATPVTGASFIGLGHPHVAALTAAASCQIFTVAGEGLDLSRNITRAVCSHLGVREDIIEQSLISYKGLTGRLTEYHFPGLSLIDDTWNANPLSMKLGLETLRKRLGLPGRRVAILGWMAELGDDAIKHHGEIGQYARGCVDLLVGVGELSKNYSPDLWFEDSEACLSGIGNILKSGDCVLIKGSHSAGTAAIAEAIKRMGDAGQFS